MNVLKSILLSSALITTTFGAAYSFDSNEEAAKPSERGLKRRAEADASGDFKTGKYPPSPADLFRTMLGMLSGCPDAQDLVYAISRDNQVCADDGALVLVRDTAVLNNDFGLIVTSLLLHQRPVREIMRKINTLGLLMQKIGVAEDTDANGEVLREHYEQADRKEIVAKLTTYAEKSSLLSQALTEVKTVITAANIAEGRPINDGDVVVLSYDDMITHKAALNDKDIHLCVDVRADTNGQLVFDKTNLPKGLKKLYFQNTAQDVTSIGGIFLYECKGLIQVDLSAFRNVTSIGDLFLARCEQLHHVDLSAFTKVTKIGSGFLSRCKKLSRLDLSAFTNIDHIQDEFLTACDELTFVNLSGFGNVTTIWRNFLWGCRCLRQLDLSGFENVTIIGEGFIAKCTGLENIKVRRYMQRLLEGKITVGQKNKIVLVD